MSDYGAAAQPRGSAGVNHAPRCCRAATVTGMGCAAEPTLRRPCGASACAARTHDRILIALA